MSYIDITRRSRSSSYENTVCITRSDCEILRPYFEKALNDVKPKFEKYEDIHNGGEATEREENLRMKYQEKYERLESVISDINTILKQKKL